LFKPRILPLKTGWGKGRKSVAIPNQIREGVLSSTSSWQLVVKPDPCSGSSSTNQNEDRTLKELQLLQGTPKAADAHYSTSEKRGVTAGDGIVSQVFSNDFFFYQGSFKTNKSSFVQHEEHS
jgi:hypothetical protein